jgi:hypothetical protein
MAKLSDRFRRSEQVGGVWFAPSATTKLKDQRTRFPSFYGTSQFGTARYAPGMSGSWSLLFTLDPVGWMDRHEEAALFAAAQNVFREGNVEFIAFCKKPPKRVQHWVRAISRRAGCRVRFPIISDPASSFLERLALCPERQRGLLLLNPNGEISFKMEQPHDQPWDLLELNRRISLRQRYTPLSGASTGEHGHLTTFQSRASGKTRQAAVAVRTDANTAATRIIKARSE